MYKREQDAQKLNKKKEKEEEGKKKMRFRYGEYNIVDWQASYATSA